MSNEAQQVILDNVFALRGQSAYDIAVENGFVGTEQEWNDSVNANRVAAEAAEAAAGQSETSAAASEASASNSADTASTAATSAATDADTATAAASAAQTSETNAATSATNAATSETNAATSASAASTSATEAATSAQDAQVAEQSAEASALTATSAAASAAVTDNIKPDTATGIAQTTSGQYFSVISPTDSGFIDLYLNDSGTAVYQDTYPNLLAIKDLSSFLTEEKKTGSSDLSNLRGEVPNKINYRATADEFVYGGILKSADLVMVSSGDVIFYTYSRSDDTFTPFLSKTITVDAGVSTVEIGLEIPRGGYVGIYSAHIDTQFSQWVDGLYFGSTPLFSSTLQGTGIAYAVTFTVEKYSLLKDVINQVDDLKSSAGNQEIAKLSGNELFYCGGGGQSNAAGGSSGTADVTLYAKYGSLSFTNNTTTLTPAQAPEGGDEYWGYNGSAYLRELLNKDYEPYSADKNNVVIFGRHAQSGTKIADLSKGTTTYQNGLNQLAAARDYADANGVNFVHVCNNFWQGERDAVLGTDPAQYTNLAKQYAIDYDADTRAIYPINLIDKRYTLAVQSSNKVNNEGDATIDSGWNITQAQYDAHAESDLYHIVAPMYAIDGGGLLHASSLGYAEMGAYIARSHKNILEKGQPRNPLEAVDWYIDGADIVLLYTMGSLSISPSADYPAQTQSGFRVFNASAGEVTATVSASGNEVRLTPSEAPASGFSWSYGNISATFQGGQGGGGNLYSESDSFVVKGKTLYDRAILQNGVVA